MFSLGREGAHVRLPFAILLSLACTSCAITREQAIATATQEITRRHLPLPRGYTVEVKDSRAFVEAAPSYQIYGVIFTVPGTHTQTPLYEVIVDRRDGKVDDMVDFRYTVPVDQ